LIGYKWVSDGGVVFEIGTGAGRAFGEKLEVRSSVFRFGLLTSSF